MKARYAAGFAAQGLASATNLSLSILAGHAAGPSGLGTVFTGFAAYAAAFGLHRAFVTTPLIASTSALESLSRKRPTSAALTIVLVTALLASTTFLAAGLLIDGTVGTGLLLFAPWLAPALVQQFARAIFFRDGGTRQAVVNDLAWFAVVVTTAPLVLRSDSEWAVVAAWGAGSVAAACLALTSLRTPLTRLGVAWRWWRDEASGFGSWLAVQEFVYIVTGYGMVVVMADVLGSSDLGGLRAAENVFAPFSLIAPAIVLPGLPAMARVMDRSAAEARRLATTLSACTIAVTGLYLGAALVVSDDVLGWVFGPGFEGYGSLVWPMGIWQVVAASALGFSIYLQAQQRGRALMTAGILASVSGLALVILLAPTYGAKGAAWAYAGGAAFSTVATIVFALRRSRRDQPPHVI